MIFGSTTKTHETSEFCRMKQGRGDAEGSVDWRMNNDELLAQSKPKGNEGDQMIARLCSATTTSKSSREISEF